MPRPRIIWDIAPDTGGCTLEIQGTVQVRSFLIEVGAIKALRPSKGQEPAGAKFSHRDLSRRTGYPTSHSSLTKESVMGIIAWIVLGLGAGLAHRHRRRGTPAADLPPGHLAEKHQQRPADQPAEELGAPVTRLIR